MKAVVLKDRALQIDGSFVLEDEVAGGGATHVRLPGGTTPAS